MVDPKFILHRPAALDIRVRRGILWWGSRYCVGVRARSRSWISASAHKRTRASGVVAVAVTRLMLVHEPGLRTGREAKFTTRGP